MSSHLRKVDAKNRSLRVVLQGLAYTALAAIVMVLLPVFTNAHSWGDFQWKLIGFALVQAVGTSILAYLMRTVLDPSGLPTPLPPALSGEPSDPVPPVDERGEVGLSLGLLIAIFVGVVLLLFRVKFGG